jgi:hypothetical protein
MAGAEKRAMPDNTTDQSSKRRKVRFFYDTFYEKISYLLFLKIFRHCVNISYILYG